MLYNDWLLVPALTTLVLLLTIISIIDIRTLTIPNSLNLVLASLGLGFQGLVNQEVPVYPIIGAVLLVGLFLAVRTLYQRRRGVVGLGLGDVKLAGASALWLQPMNLPVFVFFSSATALLFLLLFGNWSKRYQVSGRLPFAPFLAIGLLISWGLETFTELGLLV